VTDELDAAAWKCTDASECGIRDGKPMDCWRGYCMPTCQPIPDPNRRDYECIETGDPERPDGVRLEKCSPANGNCAPGFECYRTDLVLDLGVCVPFNVCTKDSECPGEDRTYCASEILNKRLSTAVDDGAAGAGGQGLRVFTDHLVCVDQGCAPRDVVTSADDPEGDMQCPDGEECLGETYHLSSNGLPDICVPHCDSANRCIPNYACAKDDYAKTANPLCVPGVPGVRCQKDIDCVVGGCEDTGAGFSVCTIFCNTDQDCTDALNSGPSVFRCAGARPDGEKICLNASPFQGVQCDPNDADPCPPEAPNCIDFSPYNTPHSKPECRMGCSEDRPCPRRGGLGHVCLGDGGCYPGGFGLPCRDPSECLSPFSCLDAKPTGRQVLDGSKICSLGCHDDSDCLAEPVFSGSAYCEDDVCRVPAQNGRQCDRSVQCLSGHCDLSAHECKERP
jgi:hypothetical protein